MSDRTLFSVLVVEDSADLAANIADFLESHGHQVDVAQDGVTGLHLVKRICDRCGWQVRLESGERQATTVTVVFAR